MPTICGPVLRNCPLILNLQMKTQQNSWNFVSTYNMHEIGAWPMDMVPMDIMLGVESFGIVWC
jgi:hypothetical protein